MQQYAFRFWPKVEIAPHGFCWLWQASKNGSSGYGLFKIKGKYKQAHRVAYELTKGPIPEGLVLDHLCRNRLCVNPDHLEPVTIGENISRGDNHFRRATHCKRGHEFTSDNTLILSTGSRACRACARLRMAAFMEKKHAAA